MRKKFTDLFINRPVLATVISLLIFFVGLRAIFGLPVREFPKIDNTVITISTTYPGASSDLIQGFITTPIEKELASADGVDYITSESTNSVSTIHAYIKLNFDPNIAFTSIMSKVAAVRSLLPREAEDPVVQKQTGSSHSLMYIAFNSTQMTGEQITDYISRVVQPKLETVAGVSQAQILGGKFFAMRVWLNPKKMAALGVTANEIAEALQANNFQSAAGNTKGSYLQISVDAKTDIQDPIAFGNMIIKQDKGALVRLNQVARVQLGSQSYDSSVIFNGEKAVFIGVDTLPTANPLTVISDVKQALPVISRSFPPSLHAKVVYDATKYIRSSIDEVIKTILEASLIVIAVIFLFLGSWRSLSIPMITIPLSLIGVFGVMMLMGYSINLLTLLALVLAIGMVVDDAIVVVENIYRHIEDGMPPLDAAIQGAREIATPVISMTITLAAVYAPIGLMTGLTGALFKEFAFTLASAVMISGLVALTLSPMMCSKMLTADIASNRFVHAIDERFHRLKQFYQSKLSRVLETRSVVIFFAFVVLISCLVMFMTSQHEMAPAEDQGVVFVVGSGPKDANIDYIEKFSHEFNAIYQSKKAGEDYFLINGMGSVNSILSALIMKPWDERKTSEAEMVKMLQNDFHKIAGLQVQAFPLPSLPVGGGALPIDFVLTSTRALSDIYPVMQDLLTAARNSGLFMYITGSLKYDKPKIEIQINRAKAAQMGISMQQIAGTLATGLGGNYVNLFSLEGRSYRVIPQLERAYRKNPSQLNQLYLKNNQGQMLPLSTIVTLKHDVEPNTLTRFQQLNSATIQGLMTPGHTLAEGLTFLENAAASIPKDMSIDYGGQSRQFKQEGNALMLTFLFSIIVIFLVLSAQFESFKDPLVIMISVPMAISGALLPINWGLASLNIYTQIGLITLIGLISKHGILMVDFANKLRQKNAALSLREAIEEAAAIRLRPVLMTTAAMILGVVPLLLATGAGANSRFDIGLVIIAGMSIGTLFTLFVVPCMYTLKSKHILYFLVSVAAVGFLIVQILSLLA